MKARYFSRSNVNAAPCRHQTPLKSHRRLTHPPPMGLFRVRHGVQLMPVHVPSVQTDTYG
jgi:hypothetical protein